jgi:hypothetical protein
MPRFLVEVPHDNTKEACDRAIQLFQSTGSHFVTNADWGCGDNVHNAWFVAEVDSREEALSLLPPLFRRVAKVVALEKLSSTDLQRVRDEHMGEAPK